MLDGWLTLFEWSKQENRGLNFYVNGAVIAGIVTEFSHNYVEAKNRDHESIVIRIDRLDAVAGK